MASGSDHPTHTRDAIEGRVALPFDGAPDWIMWMPGGTHTITGSKRGRPVTVQMAVDAKAAATMQRQLGEHMAGGKLKPFFDFDHKNEAASAWPVEFAWRDGQDAGIYARVEWSDEGRAAISGKRYRAFSPRWYETQSDPSEVEGAPLNMGGLVNDPAFREISPLWAKSADSTNNTDNTAHMNATPTELAALQARIAELEKTNTELKSAVDADDADAKSALEASQAEATEAKRKLDEMQAQLDERKRRDADACVASAVSRGAIAAKDDSAKDRWRKLIMADPVNAELLAKQPGRPALTAGRISRPAIEIVKADTNDILRGYMSAGTPRDKGLFYHREIKPMLDKGENVLARVSRIPLEGSNTLGTLVNALVSQRTIELVYSVRPMLKGVFTDFSDEVKSLNDTVKTRTIGLPTVQTFGGTVSATADTDVTVTLDQFKEVKYTYTAAELAGTARDLVKEHAESLAVGLGNSIVDALCALITEANFGSTATTQTIKAASSCDFSTITWIAKKMNTIGVPPLNRFAWIDADVAEALANDELMVQYYNRDPVVNAYSHWVNVKGFSNVWEYPQMSTILTAENVIGFFAHKSALIISARVPPLPMNLPPHPVPLPRSERGRGCPRGCGGG